MSPYFKNCVLGSDVVTHICIFSWPLAVSRDLFPPDPYIPYNEIPIGTEFHRKLEHIFNPQNFPRIFCHRFDFLPTGNIPKSLRVPGGGEMAHRADTLPRTTVGKNPVRSLAGGAGFQPPAICASPGFLARSGASGGGGPYPF